MLEANWSGEWPHLCCGKWTLVVDGKDESDKIPEDLHSPPMNTYDSWHLIVDKQNLSITMMVLCVKNGLKKTENGLIRFPKI